MRSSFGRGIEVLSLGLTQLWEMVSTGLTSNCVTPIPVSKSPFWTRSWQWSSGVMALNVVFLLSPDIVKQFPYVTIVNRSQLKSRCVLIARVSECV